MREMDQRTPAFYIRPGRPGEAPALARLHVDVWRQTYRDLAPPEAYTALGVDRRLPYWEAALRSDDPMTAVLVAITETEIAGVVSMGPPRDPALGDGAEIKHLYIGTAVQRSGLGRALMQAAFDHLREIDVAAANLAVVEGNENALRFYRHLGGREAGRFTDAGPLWKSANIVMRWSL